MRERREDGAVVLRVKRRIGESLPKDRIYQLLSHSPAAAVGNDNTIIISGWEGA